MNYFQLNVHDSILHVQMARGEKYNALNVEMLNEFSELVDQIKTLGRCPRGEVLLLWIFRVSV